MAFHNRIGTTTAVISDASIAVARIVTGDTTDTTNTSLVMKAATGATTKPLGITFTKTEAVDKEASICYAGITELEVNGTSAIDINDSIIATAAGVGVIAGTPAATQQWAIGYALEPSAASGDVISVLVSPHLIVEGDQA